MAKLTQSTYTVNRFRKQILCVGDSMTYNVTYDMTADKYYPHVLQTLLNTAGYPLVCRNFGRAGNTTGDMILRQSLFTQWGVPDIAIIHGSVNDYAQDTTVAASPAPTTTVFSVGAGKGQYYQVGSYLTVVVGGTTYSRLISSVATDAITISTALPSAPVAGAAVTIDTTSNIVAMATYLSGLGVGKFIICGMGYENLASGGDTLATPLAANVTLRAKQSAAATAIGSNATYVDLYTPMRTELQAQITAGSNSEGSGSWNQSTTDIHYNAVGSALIASIIKDAIIASSALTAAIAKVTDV